MAESKRHDEWGRASSLMAVIHNSNCTERNQLAKPADFNPLIKRPHRTLNVTHAAAMLAAHIRGSPSPAGLIGGGTRPVTLDTIKTTK